ncbi:hypothetical protein N0V90_013481 [Kalmusia sp. IMI 367209]|nr:hypothetical protein N0V90_013481 [Kalmusia sp. IMI 367209]
MATKRKAAGLMEIPTKKSRRAIPSLVKCRSAIDTVTDDASDAEVGSLSDSPDDRIINYTDNGKKRADSEAKRTWNYVCDFQGCGQRFNRPCRLEAHMRSHSKERPFVCPHDDCDKTFPRKDHLQRHLKHSHAEPERNFACDWEGCGKTFTSNGRLQRHKEVHDSKFYCTGFPPCKEPFRKQKTLDAHIKTVHLETKAYPCTHVNPDTGEQCMHGYQTENGLRRHVAKVHGDKEERRYFCIACPMPGTKYETTQNVDGDTFQVPKEPLSFSTAAELQAHDREAHPPTCSVCGQVFKRQDTLNSHFQALHRDPADQQLFQCPYQECGKSFNRKSNLHVHITHVHENQKHFVCSLDAMQKSKHPDLSSWNGENACDKQFKTKSALEQHVRTHHLGLQNRKATRQLAKARKRLIPDPSALTLLTGVGYEEGRPITCLLNNCLHRFARDRDLKRHMVTQHGYTDADCQTAILERDAENGGQFWIGGLEDYDPFSTSGSTDPSLPQTPMTYFDDQAMHVVDGGFNKMNDHNPFNIDPALVDVNMLDFNDTEIDLSGFTAGIDQHGESQLDLLAPVKQYNAHMHD